MSFDWNDAIDPKAIISFFDLYEHAIERLVLVRAFLGLEVSEGWI